MLPHEDWGETYPPAPGWQSSDNNNKYYVPVDMQVRHSIISDSPEDYIVASRNVYGARSVHKALFTSGLDSLEGSVTLDQLTHKQTVVIVMGAQKEINLGREGV